MLLVQFDKQPGPSDGRHGQIVLIQVFTTAPTRDPVSITNSMYVLVASVQSIAVSSIQVVNLIIVVSDKDT